MATTRTSELLLLLFGRVENYFDEISITSAQSPENAESTVYRTDPQDPRSQHTETDGRGHLGHQNNRGFNQRDNFFISTHDITTKTH